jgi:hypothetical protein
MVIELKSYIRSIAKDIVTILREQLYPIFLRLEGLDLKGEQV